MKKIFALSIIFSLICACSVKLPDVTGTPGFSSVTFRLEDDAADVKSVMPDENKLRKLFLWAYNSKTGNLENAFVYSENSLSGGIFEASLKNGCSYTFFMLANVRSADAPHTLAAAEAMTLDVVESEMASEGFPMSCRISDIDLKSDISISFSLKRLVSRFVILINKEKLKYGKFKLLSASLKQQAADLAPFAARSKATKVFDSEPFSEQDLQYMESGRPVTFYAMENCRGTLLENNSDPWKKIPQDETERRLATFLEVRGEYSSPTVEMEEVCVRMYLGKDNVSNFDVMANNAGVIHLYLSDDGVVHGVLEDTWKVEPETYEIVGSLAFDKSVLRVAYIDSEPFFDRNGRNVGRTVLSDTVSVLRNSDNLDYTISCEGEGTHIQMIRKNDDVVFRDISGGKYFGAEKVRLESYDHLLSDELTVICGTMKLGIGINPNSGHIEMWSENGNPMSVQFKVDVAITVNGSVTVHPSGTMFAGTTYYRTKQAVASNKIIPVEAPKTIDDGKLVFLLGMIYGYIEADSYNAIGSANLYKHRYHPDDVTIDVSIESLTPGDVAGKVAVGLNPEFLKLTEDGYADPTGWALYPVGGNTVHFYHQQEGRLYPVSLKETLNGIAVVSQTSRMPSSIFEM